jgi:hypothetical protein
MFDWLSKKEDPNEAAMKKQQDFARKQGILGVAAQPHDEMSYRAAKQERDDLTRWQQEFEKELLYMVHELKNEELTPEGWIPKKRQVYDEDTKTYRTYTIPPLCNDWFAEEVKRQVGPFLNKNFINSNLDQHQILMKLKKTHNEIACIISDNWGKHGIETTADASAITRAIKNYVDPAAFRALGGWTKIKDTEIAKRIETHDNNNELKRETGLLGGMLHG